MNQTQSATSADKPMYIPDLLDSLNKENDLPSEMEDFLQKVNSLNANEVVVCGVKATYKEIETIGEQVTLFWGPGILDFSSGCEYVGHSNEMSVSFDFRTGKFTYNGDSEGSANDVLDYFTNINMD